MSSKMKNINKIIFVLLGLCFLFGCATQKKKPQDLNLAWPPPPDISRIRYITSIYGTEGIKKTKFAIVKEWITGKKSGFFLLKPYGVYVDHLGKVYITDSTLGRVLRLDYDNHEYKLFGEGGPVPLYMPIGVCVDQLENVYVTDVYLDKVIVYNRIGETILIMGKKGEFDNPSGIFVKYEKIYIVDTGHHCIKIYFKDGLLQKVIGKRGGGDGEFNFPTNIWVDDNGTIYVTDMLNFRVQIFNKTGEFMDKFGKPGSRYGFFSKPKGIAVDSDGHIYS